MSDNTTYRKREPARRVFAAELEQATHQFKEGDDKQAPKYVILPSGEVANRVLLVGTLTETEDIGDDDEYWRARVVDPTGGFLMYAGQYDQDAMATIRNLDGQVRYVAVVGKPKTYTTDDGDVLVSIRPESITTLDDEGGHESKSAKEQMDIAIHETAKNTLDRIESESEYEEDIQTIYGMERREVAEIVTKALTEYTGEAVLPDPEEAEAAAAATAPDDAE